MAGARRLSAIMFTDMVGFTEAAQVDEAAALARLREQDGLVRPVLAGHGGRVVKSTGDGLLVEFESVLKAAECAVAVQRRLADRNGVGQGPPLEIRIGLHVGDVEAQNGDILGDAVNVAFRLVGLAPPGGVCVSSQVYEHLRGKAPFGWERFGPVALKGVRDPSEVYRLLAPPPGTVREPLHRLLSRRLAILPLVNISPDPQDEYFADGLTEELISTLSKLSGLQVISRTSVMQYKNRAKPIPEIGRELGSGTIIEGSVRKAGKRVRVMIDMVDAARDARLWGETYDRELEDIFAIQEEIARRATAALKVELASTERSDLARRPTANVDAYQLYLQGRYHSYRRSRDENTLAVHYFQDAIDLDPGCAVAYAGMAGCYHAGSHEDWFRPAEAYPRMRALATRALEIDPRLSEAHAVLGEVFFHYDWKWGDAEQELRRAIELKPSSGDVFGTLAYLLAVLGRREEAEALRERGNALSPEVVSVWGQVPVGSAGQMVFPELLQETVPRLAAYVEANPSYPPGHQALAFLYLRDGQPERAVAEIRRAEALSPGEPRFRGALAWLLALVGRHDEARALLDELLAASRTRYVSEVAIASVLYALGQPDEAFAHLDAAFEDRATELADVRLMPEMDRLRTDPRWGSIERRMGLPAR